MEQKPRTQSPSRGKRGHGLYKFRRRGLTGRQWQRLKPLRGSRRLSTESCLEQALAGASYVTSSTRYQAINCALIPASRVVLISNPFHRSITKLIRTTIARLKHFGILPDAHFRRRQFGAQRLQFPPSWRRGCVGRVAVG